MRITRYLLAAAALLAAPLLCSAAGTMQNAGGREGVSLRGPWHFLIDPYESGYYNYRHVPSPTGMGTNHKPATKSEMVEYDFDAAPTLMVPGDWNTQRPELMYYEGTVWYERNFDYTVRPGRRIFLWFGAANYRSIVYLNGKKLGEHEGGFTPFQFEVTGQLKEKGNFVVVKVDDSRHQDDIPTLMTDWWNYGGLTRDVRVIDVPENFIEDYSLQLARGSNSKLTGWVRVNGTTPRQNVTIAIAGVATKSVTTDANGYAVFELDAKVDTWSPENPKLYDVTFSTASGKIADRLGFRTIEARGRDILLNGKPVRLRGASIHAEAPFRAGRVWSEADARTLLGWAKELGCNFVRLPHYPHDEVMTRMADEMGLMVWSEVPVYWTISWENATVYHNAETQLTDMINRDHNRASIILWSVANETPRSDARLAFLGKLADKARALDPSRLITAALETHYVNPATIRVEDPLGKYLDVVSCNEYVGWYDGPPAKIDTITWETAYEKPFVISEFGADAQAGRHGDDMTIWTEEFQANVYRRQVGMFKRIPFLNGTIAWVLVDFRSPRRMLNGVQDGYNRKGLFSDRGDKKQAFDILHDYYTKP